MFIQKSTLFIGTHTKINELCIIDNNIIKGNIFPPAFKILLTVYVAVRNELGSLKPSRTSKFNANVKCLFHFKILRHISHKTIK